MERPSGKSGRAEPSVLLKVIMPGLCTSNDRKSLDFVNIEKGRELNF